MTSIDAKQKHNSKSNTYSPKSNNLPSKLPPNIFWDAVKIEDKLWERLAVMSLPLSNSVQRVRRWLLTFRPLHLRLAVLFTSSNQLLFKGTRNGIVGPSREKLRLSAMVCCGPASRRRPSILFHRVHHLLLWWRLAVGNLDLPGASSFGRHEPCPMGGIGSIRHVGERSASRHVQGGLGRWRNEYSGHVVALPRD